MDVELYEAAGHFSAVGAGISVWPRAIEVMEMMGMGPDLQKVASAPFTEDYGQSKYKSLFVSEH